MNGAYINKHRIFQAWDSKCCFGKENQMQHVMKMLSWVGFYNALTLYGHFAPNKVNIVTVVKQVRRKVKTK